MALALAGAGVFRALGLPLPFLLGPLFACLAAALAGVPLRGLPRASAAMRTVLGLAVGLTITPAFVASVPALLASLALVPLMTAGIGAVGTPYFRRLGFGPATAYYAAMPGGLQDMLVFGEEAGADVRALSLIHATRVLMVVTALPLVLTAMGQPLGAPPGAPAHAMAPQTLALMAVLALGGWAVAVRAGLFGASILGPMIAGAAASLAGLVEQRPPAEAILAAQFFIGLGVGVKYSGITAAEVRRCVAAAAGYTVVIAAVAALFGGAAVALGLLGPLEALLAFSPGGQAEMAVLAIVAGAEVATVVAHHVLRMVTVILGAPLAARLVIPPRPPRE